MSQKQDYKTKQRECIETYLQSRAEHHVTAAEIVGHFKTSGIPVGLTTIYRHLDKLVEQGKVSKFVTDHAKSACYQYIGGESCPGAPHFHLKCTGCGRLIHMQCDHLLKLQAHVQDVHDFVMQPLKTTFYGTCKSCAEKLNRVK